MTLQSQGFQSRILLPVILNTILTLSALYAPQPLLPTISTQFAVSREAAAALTTVTFVPLAIAPLVYGYLLESFSPTRLLKFAVSLLAVSELIFAAVDSFPLLLAIRLFQGILIPAMLPADVPRQDSSWIPKIRLSVAWGLRRHRIWLPSKIGGIAPESS